MASRGLKICAIVTAIILIIVAVVILTLAFTIFKIKDPIVSLTPVGLENVQFFTPDSSTAPLHMIITIVNRNYGAFESMDSTGYLQYRDTVVAKIPLAKNTIPARSTVNVTTTANLMSEKLLNDEHFITDLDDGTFKLTSNAILPGKVHLLIRLKATVNINCDVLFNITSMTTDSNCIAKIKL